MEASKSCIFFSFLIFQAIQKVNFKSGGRRDVHSSSIVIGDDAASTTKAIEQHEAKRQASASASSTTVRNTSASKSTMEKQSKSTGVASTVVQSKDQSAAISAVNTDKFASSLRESSGVQIGTQKDVSVIDAHRRQSQVNSYQSQQQYQQQSQQQYHQQQQYSNNMFGGNFLSFNSGDIFLTFLKSFFRLSTATAIFNMESSITTTATSISTTVSTTTSTTAENGMARAAKFNL